MKKEVPVEVVHEQLVALPVLKVVEVGGTSTHTTVVETHDAKAFDLGAQAIRAPLITASHRAARGKAIEAILPPRPYQYPAGRH